MWEIPKGNVEPTKLPEGAIDVEKTLEEWVENHPDLVEPGLTVLARQLPLDGGVLDLLCLDAHGRLVVVELKRGEAYRAALAQLLDYAACVGALPCDELKDLVDGHRNGRGESATFDDILQKVVPEKARGWTPDAGGPRLMIVGTGADESLRRIVAYLTTKYQVPVNGVFFDVFASTAGGTLLARSAVVADEEAARQRGRRGRGGMPDEDLRRLAEDRGVLSLVEPVLHAWQTATGRRGRPEPDRYWSLARKSDGRVNAAWLYPWDDDTARRTAWLKLEVPSMAADASVAEAGLWASLADMGIAVSDGVWVELRSDEEVAKVVRWIEQVYGVTAPAPAS